MDKKPPSRRATNRPATPAASLYKGRRTTQSSRRNASTQSAGTPAKHTASAKVAAPGKAAADPTKVTAPSTAASEWATAPELSDKQRRHLRGLAHELKPVIRLGNSGLTAAVASETARALHDHELIKVKAPGGDREARDTLFTELAERTGSALVYRIGNIAVLYRPRPGMPKILIPDA